VRFLSIVVRTFSHLNPKTLGKWKKWTHGHDVPMGLNQSRSTNLTLEEEVLIVTFRQHTLLPLDDFLYQVAEKLDY
jgi:hypothetical protein